MDSIIEKLRKLIAHEVSARSIGNIEEANAFADRIQTLLTAHRIEVSDVQLEKQRKSETIGFIQVDERYIRTSVRTTTVWWKMVLANTIAEHNSCRYVGLPVKAKNSHRIFLFVGHTSNREICKMLYIYFVELAEDICKTNEKASRQEQAAIFNKVNNLSMPDWVKQVAPNALVPPYAEKAFKQWMKHYRNAWFVGFSDALVTRMSERHAAPSNQPGLVLIKRDALEVKNALEGQLDKKNRKEVKADVKSLDGLDAGVHTGEAVSLSPTTFPGAKGRASRLLGE